MNAEEKKSIILVSYFFTAVHKFLFVSDLIAPAKIRVAEVQWAGDFQFAGDTDATSAHLSTFKCHVIANWQDLVKGEANIGSRIGPSRVTASVRTLPCALIGFKAATGAGFFLDSHKTSVLHRLVILFRDGKVLSPCDGLVLAFSLVRGHQSLSLPVGDPSLPSLQHVVGGRVWNLPGKRKA